MRGSLKLSLSRSSFKAGETIAGTIDLHAKKPIEGNKLVTSLIGVKVTRTHEDGESRTRSHEIYRDEVIVEDAKQYPSGHKSNHKFEILAPNTASSEFMNSTIGQALSSTLSVLTGTDVRLEWRVEVRLDAQGVDLADSESISLNV